VRAPLHRLDVGAGPPRLLVHGDFLDGPTTWAAQIETLAGHHRLIVPDRRGRGQSPKEPRPYTIEGDAADDARRAIRFVRAHAADYGVDPHRIGVMGFSAGGHLAATVGTHYPDTQARVGAADSVSARPDFMILVYPVVTLLDPLAHKGSRTNLLGATPDSAMVRRFSNETQVTAETPPTFIVTTTDDRTVPVQNSLLFYDALRAAKVPAELHVYETGPHGFGPDPADPILATWKDRCVDWMRRHGWIEGR